LRPSPQLSIFRVPEIDETGRNISLAHFQLTLMREIILKIKQNQTILQRKTCQLVQTILTHKDTISIHSKTRKLMWEDTAISAQTELSPSFICQDFHAGVNSCNMDTT